MIKIPKKGKYIKIKNYSRKIKSPFTIYGIMYFELFSYQKIMKTK